MKKLITLILISFLSITILRAQEADSELTYEQDKQLDETVQIEDEENKSVKSTNQYFEIELVRGLQSPITKNIPFTLYITPKIDSPKTQILWNVPSVFTIEEDHNEFVSLEKDITYTYSVTVNPQKEGSYDITVNVISWQYNTNKSNSANYNITLNSSYVVQPTDSQYTLVVLLLILAILLGSGLVTFLLIKGVKILIKRAKFWLTPPI